MIRKRLRLVVEMTASWSEKGRGAGLAGGSKLWGMSGSLFFFFSSFKILQFYFIFLTSLLEYNCFTMVC